MAADKPEAGPASVSGKRILITGGTGSFGRHAARRFLQEGVEEIRILSRDELKQELMRQEFGDDRLAFYLGDVRHRAGVDQAMRDVDLVFHAAALKQVPSCEFFPMQAVMTNVMGSHNVIESAIAHEVERVVCLGTDKAAYPINTMGITKALMEKVAQAAGRLGATTGTTVCTVRYGNVIASRGSVVPLFIKQLKDGGPLSITEPTMTRFLLPLPRAIDLVVFAMQHAGPGDLFVRKAPASTVADLAQAIREIFQTDVPEKIIGIRHGEKLYETLATRDELSRAEDMGDYYRVSMDDRDLNYSLYFSEGNPDETRIDDYTSHNTDRLTVEQIKDILLPLDEVQQELDGWKVGT